MITGDAIAKVFGIMRASYGHLWPHGDDAMQVWFKKLARYTEGALMRAADSSLKTHPNRPPTLSQFHALCHAYSEPDYKQLPAPTKTKEDIIGQRAMLKVVVSRGGVANEVLGQMVGLKNALVEEADKYEGRLGAEIVEQLTALADGYA